MIIVFSIISARGGGGCESLLKSLFEFREPDLFTFPVYKCHGVDECYPCPVGNVILDSTRHQHITNIDFSPLHKLSQSLNLPNGFLSSVCLEVLIIYNVQGVS